MAAVNRARCVQRVAASSKESRLALTAISVPYHAETRAKLSLTLRSLLSKQSRREETLLINKSQ
jgi:hypothetical protein